MTTIETTIESPGQKFILLSVVLISMWLLSGCAPDQSPAADLTCTGKLNAHDVENLRPCIVGNWKIESAEFPTGQQQTFNNSFLRITSTDSVYYHVEGNVVAETSFTLTAQQNSIVIFFTNAWWNTGISWSIDSIADESLLLSNDATQFRLTRSQQQPTIECETYLGNKALNQIRHCIHGTWQLEYRVGGFSGADKYFYDGEIVMMFKPGDSIEYIDHASYVAKTKIEWEKIVSPSDAISYQLTYRTLDGFRMIYGIGEIHQDTLFLLDTYPDGYTYALSRR